MSPSSQTVLMRAPATNRSVPPRRGRPPGGGMAPEAVREALLDAAQRCFNEDGVAATSMDRIAHEAGFSRAWLYTHFSNRAELLIALALRTTSVHMTRLAAQLDGVTDLAEILTESLTYVSTVVAQDPLLRLLSQQFEGQSVAALITNSTELHDFILLAYQDALDRPGPNPLRPGLALSDAARYVVTVALSLLMGAVPGAHDPNQIRRYIRTFILPALLAHPPNTAPVFADVKHHPQTETMP
jgi:AcrR family transcriptional regulator